MSSGSSASGSSSAASAVTGGLNNTKDAAAREVAAPEAPQKHAFLKKRPVIGAAGTQQTFPKGDLAFHSLDMPPDAAKARFQVQEMLRLARSEKSWNPSVYCKPAPCERMQRTNSAFDPTFSGLQYNFRAEKLTESLPVEKDVFGRILGYSQGAGKLNRTAEMPPHASVVAKQEWEVRTRELFLGSRPMERRLETVTKAALEATTKRGRTMLASTGYTSPIKRESEYMEQLREERRKQADAYVQEQVEALEGTLAQPYRGGFHNSFALLESQKARARSAGLLGGATAASGSNSNNNNAGSSRAGSKERTGSAAGDENAYRGASASAGGSTLRSSSTANLQKRYKHSGAFGPVAAAVAALGGSGQAWSCCGNEDQNGRGCVLVVTNKDARCFAGI